MKKKKKVIIKTASSLQKIFPNQKFIAEQKEFSIFQNERFSFQVCCYSNEFVLDLEFFVHSELKEFITIRKVDCVPSRFAKFEKRCDTFYIRGKRNNQMYPDVLTPIRSKEVLRPYDWTCFYITVEGKLPVGDFDIRIQAKGETYAKFDKTVCYTLHVLEGELPKHNLLYTEWIHYDCICDKHSVEPFTQQFYEITNEYLKTAIKRGQNMLLTPLFTPPLDTDIGTYRRVVQLVEVRKENGQYFFSFDKVKEFFDNALELGFAYFEIAHLASQWGAIKCPRVQMTENGNVVNAFGWDVESCSKEYLEFLESFLQAFRVFADENGYTRLLYFHISDEPNDKALERIAIFREIIRKYFPENKVMDAVSDKEYIERGIIDIPFISVDVHKKSPSPYVYYCNMMRKEYVSNRFLSMPSQRTRILGMQLYRNNAKGYLHWAFNFYHSIASRYPIDPYAVTDGDGCFDGGDPFIVYPTVGGVLESIRYNLMLDGFQDLQALMLLEQLRGREYVEKILTRYRVVEGYTIYLRDAKKLLKLRLKINEEIVRGKGDLK